MTHRVAARQRAIGRVGQREAGLVIQLRDDRVEVRIEAIDLRQERRHDFASGYPPFANLTGQLARAHETQRVGARPPTCPP